MSKPLLRSEAEAASRKVARTRRLSFDEWLAVSRGLHAAREQIRSASEANDDASPLYRRAFAEWIKANTWAKQWAGEGKSSFRSAAYWLIDNLADVEAWRATLNERVRTRLSHPEVLMREYRRAHRPPTEPLTAKQQIAELRREVTALRRRVRERR